MINRTDNDSKIGEAKKLPTLEEKTPTKQIIDDNSPIQSKQLACRDKTQFANTPILEAIASRDKTKVEDYIERADIPTLEMADQQKDSQNNALILAIKQGWNDIAVKLINKGVSVHHQAADDFTALHYAALTGQDDVISALISKGADLKKLNKYNATALDYYLLCTTSEFEQIGKYTTGGVPCKTSSSSMTRDLRHLGYHAGIHLYYKKKNPTSFECFKMQEGSEKQPADFKMPQGSEKQPADFKMPQGSEKQPADFKMRPDFIISLLQSYKKTIIDHLHIVLSLKSKSFKDSDIGRNPFYIKLREKFAILLMSSCKSFPEGTRIHELSKGLALESESFEESQIGEYSSCANASIRETFLDLLTIDSHNDLVKKIIETLINTVVDIELRHLFPKLHEQIDQNKQNSSCSDDPKESGADKKKEQKEKPTVLQKKDKPQELNSEEVAAAVDSLKKFVNSTLKLSDQEIDRYIFKVTKTCISVKNLSDSDARTLTKVLVKLNITLTGTDSFPNGVFYGQEQDSCYMVFRIADYSAHWRPVIAPVLDKIDAKSADRPTSGERAIDQPDSLLATQADVAESAKPKDKKSDLPSAALQIAFSFLFSNDNGPKADSRSQPEPSKGELEAGLERLLIV
jgi:ankyrin repeat protein